MYKSMGDLKAAMLENSPDMDKGFLKTAASVLVSRGAECCGVYRQCPPFIRESSELGRHASIRAPSL